MSTISLLTVSSTIPCIYRGNLPTLSWIQTSLSAEPPYMQTPQIQTSLSCDLCCMLWSQHPGQYDRCLWKHYLSPNFICWRLIFLILNLSGCKNYANIDQLTFIGRSGSNRSAFYLCRATSASLSHTFSNAHTQTQKGHSFCTTKSVPCTMYKIFKRPRICKTPSRSTYT